jgi:DNA-binding transcriptional regulator YiaG
MCAAGGSAFAAATNPLPAVLTDGIPGAMTPHDVQTIRRRLRMTQRELALALGVTVTTVARWEQGARAVTSLVAASLGRLVKEHGMDQLPLILRKSSDAR